MNYFDHATMLLDKQLGNDVVIALATYANDEVTVRNTDGYYRDGAVYVLTHAASHKMKQIAVQPNVGFCKNYSRTRHFYEGLLEATGIGENIGSPKGHEMEEELKDVFSSFYDHHVDEDDPLTCILKITLAKAVVFDGEYKYVVDFAMQTAERIVCPIN